MIDFPSASSSFGNLSSIMLKLSNEVKSKHKERISDELRFVSTKGRSESRASGYFNIGSSFSFLNTSSRTILCL